MKYFFDTEFIETPGSIELISIGIVSEEGRTYYAESTCFDERRASDWVKENVITKLRWYGNENSTKGFCNSGTQYARTPHEKTEVFGTLNLISQTIREFIGKEMPEFWAYYASTDWGVFYRLFWTLMDLPEGWSMYCRDIKQWCDQLGNPQLPEKGGWVHNALEDAKWNQKAWHFLDDLKLETDEVRL